MLLTGATARPARRRRAGPAAGRRAGQAHGGRRGPALGRGVDRRRRRAGRRGRHHRAAAPRRHRDVPRQARRRERRLVRAGQRQREHRPAGAARRTARGARQPGPDRAAVCSPRSRCATRRPVSVEAFVRWRHPRRGMLKPVDFVRAVEQSELLGQFTRHVLDAALARGRPAARGRRAAAGRRSTCRRAACTTGSCPPTSRSCWPATASRRSGPDPGDHRDRGAQRGEGRRRGAGRASATSACSSPWTTSAPAAPR